MYKKIYLEITNNCNLDCSFCIKNNRAKKFINEEEFKKILTKLKGYTNYLYFHVSGEPLLHPKINEFIDLASKDFKINITTNGYLINRIINNKNIRQVNISLHSYDPKYNISLEDYLNNIFNVIDNLKDTTYFSLRLWANNVYNKDIINYIIKRYNINEISNNTNKIIENVFISFGEEFIWPELDNNIYEEYGTCYALKDHIAILSNGDIVPCCLDVNGIIKFGNIFDNDLKDIIHSKDYIEMKDGFKNNIKTKELCRKCNFIKNKN